MQKLIFTTLFSLCLSALVSGWVTYLNLGIDAGFVPNWLSAFIHAWPVALITAYLLSSPIQTLTRCIMEVFNDK
ncbi:DUF2798 domain-containing protein [Pseudoalteromonas sp. OOF1S-7]|uniref:DUF2798 domain-containing protein n=1 Tax=Pseudoalteromonas sp. OOF1S-7 TaxID=2917757 RepID=UPI001EF6E406|nr:DUF2798 domain-containing protein [Pseudoalteromonas sp. OOF1S-7]MCG7535725.1 DUF2798 domain-containing protein [Pseudoalteromonas sp. OOF1S-7]